ncbi:MAG: hypothetical protein IJ265_07780 [Oscillospiraceae bacterium]|nr:hypothetical protein [Oscillospiraceae bacterium]
MTYIYPDNTYFEFNLDIDAFLSQIDANKKAFNIFGINKYIRNWKQAFYNIFESEKNQTYIIPKNQFIESIFLSGNEIRLHFSIDKAMKYVPSYNIELIPLNLFTPYPNSSNSIKFTPINIDPTKHDYTLNDTPIIIVKFALNNFRYLTIDGNHRVTARKEHNIDFIKAVLLSYHDATELLASNFEKAIYRFAYEGFLLQDHNHYVLKNSYSHHFL